MIVVWNWLVNVLTVGGPIAVLVFYSFKWFGQRWIEQLLSRSFEKFKTEQEKDLEQYKSERVKELEQLRHLLSSRISKIHEKEFEILPKAWLMLHELHGSVCIALGLTFEVIPDFPNFSDAKFEEFLARRPASYLSDTQKDALRNASDRKENYMEAMAGISVDRANKLRRTFHNYLIEHRIFMTDELRDKFRGVDEVLTKALIEFEIGTSSKLWHMQDDARNKVTSIIELIGSVETTIQKRLHYGEA